jgi:predicted Fe-Mo cluster-binding NifX family protein
MHIAVASRDGRTVAGHIGKCQDWIVFEAEVAAAGEHAKISQHALISLPKELVFHHYKDEGPHPLSDCVAVIGASAGDSFVSKMARRGIQAVLTAETDPAKAVADFVNQQVIPPKPRPIGGLICKIKDAISSGNKA